MEPDDRHLRIAWGRADHRVRGGVVLTFEGDRLLSLLPPEAFLLANDGAITGSPSLL